MLCVYSVYYALHSMYFTLTYFTLCTMHFTLCTMHLTRCTSLDVLHADLLYSVYYALHSVYYAPVTMHSILCTSIDVLTLVYLILCVLDPMYFSEGLHTEEPFAMLSGKRISEISHVVWCAKRCCGRPEDIESFLRADQPGGLHGSYRVFAMSDETW